MVAMDSQLESVLNAVNASRDWSGQTLMSQDILTLEPTDASMLNEHYLEHAPRYTWAIQQFNEVPSSEHFNAVVNACASCHRGTCPGPLSRIEKRRPQVN